MTNAQQQLHWTRSRYFVRGAFRRFFIPALFSSFWMAVAGVADSVFVGNGIGTEGLAAIGFGQPVYLFYNILSYGFSIGGSIHYASKLAEGREAEGNRIFHTVLRLLLTVYLATAALGLLFLPQLMSLLGADPADELTRSYIRTQLIFVPIMFCQGPFYYFVNADNGPKTAALAMSASGILDTVFSYIFIIQMGLGVRGSVYSTVVGAMVMLSITGWHILKRRGALRFTWAKMDWQCVGLSARTDELLAYVRDADTSAVDYFGAGPLHETATKPDCGRDSQGNIITRSFDEIEELARVSKIPVVVGGGVKLPDIPALAKTGVDGFFVVSAVAGASDPEKAAKELVAAWKNNEIKTIKS